jgi:hypothetical protein
MQAIESWYQGNGEAGDTSIPNKTQTWNLLRVVQQMEKDEINSRIDAKPGSPEYLGQYRRVCGEVSRSLSDDVREKYEALVDEWNGKRPPKELQAK